MQIFFADDSTQIARRAKMGRLVSFGGIVVDENAVKPMASMIEDIASAFGIPADTEIKWSPGKDNWIRENLSGRKREECYARLIRGAAQLNARALVVTCARDRTSFTGDAPFEICLTCAFERLTIFLGKMNQNGIVVADRPGGGRSDEDRLLPSFLNRVRLGTEFVLPERVLLNILTAPSHMIRHVQIADLVVGATTAMVGGLYDYAPRVFDEVRPMFISNAYALAGGTGLKIFPDRLENLYYWILKERKYSLPNSAYFLPLPDSNRYYCDDEFKP